MPILLAVTESDLPKCAKIFESEKVMLTKLIDLQSFYPEDEIHITLLDLKDEKSSGLLKAAADSRITDYVSNLLQSKLGKFYVHINAMGAGEFYGSNKNADYFPESQLIQYHKTFEETGYVYKHHKNKDPNLSMGRVLFAIYNQSMHRVELIAEIDNELGRDVKVVLDRGEFPKTSMACRTPFDICSVCGNKAHTRQEYCIHLLNMPNKVLPNGSKVMALNVAPLRFIDISVVIRPADITSSVLQKVASEELFELSVDAAEDFLEKMAENWDWKAYYIENFEKQAAHMKKSTLRKLSELTKIIDDGVVISADQNLSSILDKVSDPDDKLLNILSVVPLTEALNALAELGISPSIEFLAQLISRNTYGVTLSKAQAALASELVTSVSPSKLPNNTFDGLEDVYEKDANPHLVKHLQTNSNSSLFPQEIEKRAYERYYDGYIDTAGKMPLYVTATDQEIEALRNEVMHKPDKERESNILHLLKLGGMALLAKMMISSLLDEKINKFQSLGLKYRGIDKAVAAPRLMDQAVLHSFSRQAEE